MTHSPWVFWQISLLEYLGCWLYPEFPFPTMEQGQGRLRKGRSKDKTIAEPPEAAKLLWASALRWGRALPPGTTQTGEHQLLICRAGSLVSVEAVLVCSAILFRVRPETLCGLQRLWHWDEMKLLSTHTTGLRFPVLTTRFWASDTDSCHSRPELAQTSRQKQQEWQSLGSIFPTRKWQHHYSCTFTSGYNGRMRILN